MKTSKVIVLMGLAVSLFTACSSDDNTQPGVTPDITGLTLNSSSDATSLAARVTNYKTSSANKAADATLFAGLLDMPAEPTTPAEAVELTDANAATAGTTYYIAKGKTVEFATSNKLSGLTIYVQKGGTLRYSGTNSNNTIYVLTGGKLDFTGTGLSASLTASGDKIYCYGDVAVADRFVVHNGGYFYKKGNLSIADKMADIYSNLYVDGSLRVSGLRVRNNAKINVTGKGFITPSATADANIESWEKKAEIDNEAAVHFGGALLANDLDLYSGKLYTDCSVTVEGALNLSGTAVLQTNYLNVYNKGVGTVTQKGNSQIVLGNKGGIKMGTYTTDNTNGQIKLNGDNAVAYVKADKFIYAGNDQINNFATPNTNQAFLLEFNETYKNGAEAAANKVDFDDLDITASYLKYARAGVEVKETADGCGYGMNTDQVITKPKLDVVSSIAYDHTHDISATAVQEGATGNFYVSYHTRGTGHGACLEYFTRTGNNVELKQYVADSENDLDYNHLLVANNQIYLAGSSYTEGGMLGNIALSGNTISTADKALNIVNLAKKNVENGFDANCVVPYGDNIIVASTRGYEVFNNSNKLLTTVETAGKAKHLAVSGNKIYALRYDSRNTNGDAAINGTVEVFADATMTNPEKTYTVGAIEPNNGKNAIAVNGNNLYVCRNANGISAFQNGSTTATWTWTAPVNAQTGKVKGYANGVAVKGDYIYVACGGYGLVVLDKNGNEVTHRACTDKNSANYVYVDNDGYIYVAYGQSRLQVFKLTNTKK